MTDQQLCKKCVFPILPEYASTSKGNCHVCDSPEMYAHIIKPPDNEKLTQLIEETRKRGSGSEYDCVVGWSGGRDSTCMIYELVTVHKLRCVAVFGKTPFTPQEIIDSVRSIAKKLNVKLIEVDTHKNHQKIAAFCLKEYLRTKIPILINLACAPCKYVNPSIYVHARRLGVKTVISGGNRFEYLPSGPASIDVSSENRYSFASMLKDNFARLFKGVGVLASSPVLFRYLPTFFNAAVLYVNQYSIYMRLRYSGISRFDYYHYADWDENRINQVLKELGWKLPAGCTSNWRADCVFDAIKNTAFKEQVGFTYNQALYSNLIRAGKISREESLLRLEKEGVSKERLAEALRLCGFPEDSLNSK